MVDEFQRRDRKSLWLGGSSHICQFLRPAAFRQRHRRRLPGMVVELSVAVRIQQREQRLRLRSIMSIAQNCPLVPFVPVGKNPQLRNNVIDAFNAEFYGEDRFHLTDKSHRDGGSEIHQRPQRYGGAGRHSLRADTGKRGSKTYHGVMPKIGLMLQATPDIQVFSDLTMSRDVPDMIDLTQSIFTPRPPWIANPEGQLWISDEPAQGAKGLDRRSGNARQIGSLLLGCHLLLREYPGRTAEVQCRSGVRHRFNNLQRAKYGPSGRRVRRRRRSAA